MKKHTCIVYSDELGIVVEAVNMHDGISILDGIVYYTTENGIDKQISIECLRGFEERQERDF